MYAGGVVSKQASIVLLSLWLFCTAGGQLCNATLLLFSWRRSLVGRSVGGIPQAAQKVRKLWHSLTCSLRLCTKSVSDAPPRLVPYVAATPCSTACGRVFYVYVTGLSLPCLPPQLIIRVPLLSPPILSTLVDPVCTPVSTLVPARPCSRVPPVSWPRWHPIPTNRIIAPTRKPPSPVFLASRLGRPAPCCAVIGWRRQAPTVAADTRLDHRWIDLRTPANQAIFKIQSAVCQYFRGKLASKVCPLPAFGAVAVLSAAAAVKRPSSRSVQSLCLCLC